MIVYVAAGECNISLTGTVDAVVKKRASIKADAYEVLVQLTYAANRRGGRAPRQIRRRLQELLPHTTQATAARHGFNTQVLLNLDRGQRCRSVGDSLRHQFVSPQARRNDPLLARVALSVACHDLCNAVE